MQRCAKTVATLCGRHGNYLAEWCRVILGGCPQDWVVWCSIGEGALKVGEDHERLWLDRLLLDVFKAGAEAGPATAHSSSVIGSPCSKIAAL